MRTSGRWAGIRWVAPTMVAVTLLATGCGGGGGDSASTTSSPASSQAGTTIARPSSTAARPADPSTTAAPVATTSPAVADAARLLAAADLADPQSLDAIDVVRFTDEAADAAAEAIAAGATGDELWAATWVYGSSGTDPELLAPALDADDPSVRAMAAAASLALGAAEGGPVLVAVLPVDDELRGSEPLVTVGAYAIASLRRFVNGPEVAPGTPAADAAPLWQSWWADHGGSLIFDPAARRWSAA